MTDSWRNSPLFHDISDAEIDELIRCSGAAIKKYRKGELIFDQYDKPAFMHVLVSGKAAVGKYYSDGRQSFMTEFDHPGDVFGEILLFLDKDSYAFFAKAETDTEVLRLPRRFLTEQCGKACIFHAQLINNLLNIFAEKAFFLQNRVQVLSGSTLRSRIAKTLLMKSGNHPEKGVAMTREEMAGFINATRPSVSREISAMEKDGLIHVKNHKIYIDDLEGLEETSD